VPYRFRISLSNINAIWAHSRITLKSSLSRNFFRAEPLSSPVFPVAGRKGIADIYRFQHKLNGLGEKNGASEPRLATHPDDVRTNERAAAILR